MNWSVLAVTVAVSVTAATVGNLLIPRAALAWFRALSWPRWLVPYPVFIAVGITYYLLIATVLYRALDRGDTTSVVWTIVVLVANEAWNAILFGLRSTLGAFLGMLAFTVPLTASIAAAAVDQISLLLLAVYAGWVIYDVAWTYALWRRNP